MSFDSKVKHLEGFADFSMNMGIIYVVSKVLAAIVMLPLSLLRHPIGFVRTLFGYDIPHVLTCWIYIARKVRFYKRVGLKCAGCGCWVSKDCDCPICGTEHMNAPVIAWKKDDMEAWYAQPENYRTIVKKLIRLTIRPKEGFDTEYIKMCVYVRNIKARVNRYKDNSFTNVHLSEDEAIDMTCSTVEGSIKEAYLAYTYFFMNEHNKDDAHSTYTAIEHHPQTRTRKKYQKIRCTKCGGFSVPTDPHSEDQYRTCTDCGHKFFYSHNDERLYK